MVILKNIYICIKFVFEWMYNLINKFLNEIFILGIYIIFDRIFWWDCYFFIIGINWYICYFL